MNKFVKLALVLVGIGVLSVILGCFIYQSNIGAVGKDKTMKEFTVPEGSSFLTLAPALKESGLIKSELFYKLYIKLNKPTGLEAGPYQLNETMNVKTILSVLSSGNTYNPDAITITFKEGLHMRKIAKLIADNTNHTEAEVFTLLKDQTYLDTLISTYWFLTDEIKNKNIYYSLEGYLFPNTYEFMNKDVAIKDIFKVMLDTMNQKLTPYQEQIEQSNYTVHQFLTLASIVELEAAHSDDRAGVAGVFYNRLDDNWSLGSDVTTYYASKVEMSDRDLYLSEINDYNAYNTRSSKMAGKLPVGPICNPGISAITAALNPTDHDYYYFVADKNKKTYFNKTQSGHEQTVSKLKDEGLWYEY